MWSHRFNWRTYINLLYIICFFNVGLKLYKIFELYLVILSVYINLSSIYHISFVTKSQELNIPHNYYFVKFEILWFQEYNIWVNRHPVIAFALTLKPLLSLVVFLWPLYSENEIYVSDYFRGVDLSWSLIIFTSYVSHVFAELFMH